MNASALKLRTKLVGGFLMVIVLFLCLCVYQVVRLNALAQLQDEGAARADAAVEIKNAVIKFEGVYAHVADAVINRNLGEFEADLSRDRQHAAEDVKILRGLVDTAEERAAMEEFSGVYVKYLDLAEKRLLPLLRSANPDPAEISRIDDEIDTVRGSGASLLNALSKSLHSEMEEGDRAYDSGSSSAKTVLIAATLVIGLIAMGLGLVITAYITGEVGGEPAEIAALARRLASGDLVKREGDKDSARASGISRSVLEMGESLRELIGPVNTSMASLAASSEQLKSVAGDLRGGTGRTSQMANGVAAAAEEMQTNMHSVAAAVEETNVNVSSVATAAEELTATIQEIAQRASEARSKSDGAVSTSRGLETVIANLTQSAEQIGRVTETIAEISEQTKLLALNATIEAARAGEAGKGFAVVAQEIKELARQVAAATGDISTRVEGIRQASEATKAGMSTVGGAIGEVNDMVMTIASAVEEQSITVSEISRNAAEVSEAVKESATLVAQTADVGAEVAKDVAMLKDENDALASGALGLEQSSVQLGAISGQMRELVSRFRLQ